MAKGAAQFTEKNFKAGEVIFNEGDEGGDILLIRSGSVEVFRKRFGREWPLAYLKKDEMLGVMTVLTKTKRTAAARATTDVTVLVIPFEDISALLKTMPTWGHAIIKDLIVRVQYCNELYVENAAIAVGHASVNPLALATMMASSLYPIMKLMTAKQEFIDFEELVNMLAEVFSVEVVKIREMLEHFVEAKILVSKDPDAGKHKFNLSSARQLHAFPEFVAKVKERVAHPETISSLLAVRERAQLLKLGEVAKEVSGDPVKDFKTPLAALGPGLKVLGEAYPNREVLVRADALGYLKMSEEKGQIILEFSPARLMAHMRFYDLAKAIDPQIFAEKKAVKTLTY